MAQWHGYLLIEDIARQLTAQQLGTLRAALASLGPVDAPQPAHRTHSRISPDGQRAIVEAEFDEADISPVVLTAVIASILGMTTEDAAERLNVVRFGNGYGYAQSLAAVTEYLAENAADWQPSEQ